MGVDVVVYGSCCLCEFKSFYLTTAIELLAVRFPLKVLFIFDGLLSTYETLGSKLTNGAGLIGISSKLLSCIVV